MNEFIYLGSSPYDEDCVQVGSENYSELARAECKRYIELLKKKFVDAHGREPKCKLFTKANDHDYGIYYEVVAAYHFNDPESIVKDAFWFDKNTPAVWDDDEQYAQILYETV